MAMCIAIRKQGCARDLNAPISRLDAHPAAVAGRSARRSASSDCRRAARRLPEIGRATVYNTLNELVNLGEVREITLGVGPKRYDPETARHHQHLVCERCGATRT